jgi:hypothetical protein
MADGAYFHIHQPKCSVLFHLADDRRATWAILANSEMPAMASWVGRRLARNMALSASVGLYFGAGCSLERKMHCKGPDRQDQR